MASAPRKKCPHCGELKSYQQGPLTICEACGEVLAESWALQDAVTEIYHEEEENWVQRIRSDQSHPASDPATPAADQEDRTDPGADPRAGLTEIDPVLVEPTTSDFDQALGRLIEDMPSPSDQVAQKAQHAPQASQGPHAPQPFIAVLKPPAFPKFDPTPPQSWAAPMVEPIVIPGRPHTPPPRPRPKLVLESSPTPIDIETPIPALGRTSVYIFVVAAAVAVMLLIGFWLARI